MKFKYMIATAAALGFSFLLLVTQVTTSVVAQDDSGTKLGSDKKSSVKQPVELGKVAWGRNLDEAVAKSRESNKPIALLFQEVPG
jgi:hypothetical protein